MTQKAVERGRNNSEKELTVVELFIRRGGEENVKKRKRSDQPEAGSTHNNFGTD